MHEAVSVAIYEPSNWRLPTPQEISSHIRRFIPKAQQDLQSKTTCQTREFDCLDLTLDLHSVDIYCYLKSKFGAANGITIMMRSGDTSDETLLWRDSSNPPVPAILSGDYPRLRRRNAIARRLAASLSKRRKRKAGPTKSLGDRSP